MITPSAIVAGGVDHHAKECKEKKKNMACFHCGYEKCPHRQAGTVCDGQPYCIRCQKTGHSTFQIYDCPLGLNIGVVRAIREDNRKRAAGKEVVHHVDKDIVDQSHRTDIPRSSGFRRPAIAHQEDNTNAPSNVGQEGPRPLRIADFVPKNKGKSEGKNGNKGNLPKHAQAKSKGKHSKGLFKGSGPSRSNRDPTPSTSAFPLPAQAVPKSKAPPRPSPSTAGPMPSAHPPFSQIAKAPATYHKQRTADFLSWGAPWDYQKKSGPPPQSRDSWIRPSTHALQQLYPEQAKGGAHPHTSKGFHPYGGGKGKGGGASSSSSIGTHYYPSPY